MERTILVTEKVSRTNYKINIGGKTKAYHINLLKEYPERPKAEPAHLMAIASATEVEAGGR